MNILVVLKNNFTWEVKSNMCEKNRMSSVDLEISYIVDSNNLYIFGVSTTTKSILCINIFKNSH